MTRTDTGIQVEGLTMTFGRVQALKGVDLSIARGTFVGLVGHNGAGKTTLFQLLHGQLKPTSGSVRICGHDVWAESQSAQGHLGVVPEDIAVYEWLSAREFFEFVAEVRGATDVALPLEVASLGAAGGRLIREYSQGMKRRTALAAALIGRPDVLILDEALNGMDPPSAFRIRGVLREWVEEGHTVLLSSHVLETVRSVCDRVVVLSSGEIVEDVAASELTPEAIESLFLRQADTD